MYWIYLFLFVLMIFTPEVVAQGFLFFREEDVESILIFVFGLVGLLLYLGKETALLRAIREKLSLQKESNQIRKDLVQSYSYIGEMNRHLDILRDVIFGSPHTAEELLHDNDGKIYNSVFDASFLLSQSDAAALLFVNQTDGSILSMYHRGNEKDRFSGLSGSELLATKKFWWQADGLSFARSHEESRGVVAFLVFRTAKNRNEEMGVFQILVTHALLLYSLRTAHQKEHQT